MTKANNEKPKSANREALDLYTAACRGCVEAIIAIGHKALHARSDDVEKLGSAALKFGEALESLDIVGHEILIELDPEPEE
jgi:hypothetical protein